VIKTIHALAEVLRDEQGKPIVMRGTVQDITERKVAEQKIEFLSRIYSAQSQTNQALIESKDAHTGWPFVLWRSSGYALSIVAGRHVPRMTNPFT
jgi:hypothetical protein